MPDDTPQVDYDALSKDATFRSMKIGDQRAYLSAVDKNFAGMDVNTQNSYIGHLTGTDLSLPNTNQQARTTLMKIVAPGAEGLYPGSAEDKQRMEQEAEQEEQQRLVETGAGPAAATMQPARTGTAVAAMPLAGAAVAAPVATGLTLLGSAAGNVGFEKGAQKLGANPEEAKMWGTTGGIIGGLAGGEGGVRLQRAVPNAWQSIWNRLTGTTKYAASVEEAKNANLARYRLTEQNAQLAIDEANAVVAKAKAAQPPGEAGTWADLNNSVGATPRTIRIGKGVSDLNMTYGNAGRGLLREGFDAPTLAKMTPPEQAAAIGPKWQAAGKAVQDTVDKATGDGVTLDAGKSVTGVIKERIADPTLQEKAIDLINQHQKELGIENMREATPTQALALRQSLRNDANFGPNATTDSMKGIGKALYSAVSKDLHDAVPAMKPVDQHYGDLAEAVNSIQKQVGRYATGKWTPPQTAVQKAQAKVPELPNVSPYTPLPAQPGTLQQLLTAGKNLAPWIAGGGGIGGGLYGLQRWLGARP